MDGSGLTQMGMVPALLAAISGSGEVAYLRPGATGDALGKIVVEDLEAGTRMEVGAAFAAIVSWRPTP